MRMIFKVIFAVLLFCGISLGAGSLAGTVSEKGGKAISGARVELGQDNMAVASVVTDVAGKYQVADIMPGEYKVYVFAPGYGYSESKCEIKEDATASLNFEDMAAEGVIKGRVVNENGIGVKWTDVSLAFLNGIKKDLSFMPLRPSILNKNAPVVTTDWNGYYSFNMLSAGKYKLSTDDLYFQGSINAEVASGQEVVVPDIVMSKNDCSIYGLVYGSDGKVLAGTDVSYVHLLDQDGYGVGMSRIKADGSYEIDRLCAGDYLLSFGSGKNGRAITLGKSQRLEYDLHLTGGVVRGKITEVDDKPVVGMSVMLIPDNFLSIVNYTDKTDENGDYKISGVESGNYIVHTMRDTDLRGMQTKKVTIKDNEIVEVNISLGGKVVKSMLAELAAEADAAGLAAGSGAANWSEAVAQAAEVDGLLFDMQVKVEGGTVPGVALDSQVLVSNDGYCMEMKDGATGEMQTRTFMSNASKQMIAIMDSVGRYMKIGMGENLPVGRGQEVSDPRELLRQFAGKQCVELGEKEIGGRKVQGQQCSLISVPGYKNVVTTVWTDVETDWPVQVEMVGEVSSLGAVSKVKMVMDKFRWNVKTSPALFTPEIPADYKPLMADMVMPKMDMAEALESLKMYSDKLGKFPEDTANYYGEYIKVLQEDDHRMAGDSILSSDIVKIMGLQTFTMILASEERDLQYYGKIVKVGDAEAVLMSWRLDDGKYQVIHGDLKTAIMGKDELGAKVGK